MATRWYYRACGQDLGPLSFNELARMVRDGLVTEEDLVRAEWESEWHCAAGVVGLFHTARRLSREPREPGSEIARLQPGNAAAHAPTGAVHADDMRTRDGDSGMDLADATVEDLETLLECAEPVANQPSWMRRLIEVAARRSRPVAARSRADRNEESAAVPSRLSTAIQAALSAMDVRTARRAPGRIARWLAGFGSHEFLHVGFRWGISILLGNGVAWAILRWSAIESQRLPGQHLAGHRPFPLWGPCDPMEFALLLVNSILAAGVVGYFVARGLEMMADD